MPKVRNATVEDCERLAPLLRLSDVEELRAGSGKTPIQAMLHGLQHSEWTYIVELDDGEPVAIFGLADHPVDPKCGVPWFLASDRLSEIPVRFLRGARKYVDLMLAHKPILTNYVDARHTMSIAWLEWLGFFPYKVYNHFGVGKLPFIQYVRYANV